MPHCRVQSLGDINAMIVHIAGCNNSIRHIENRFSPYFIYILFFNAFWALTSGGFRIVSDTLVKSIIQNGFLPRDAMHKRGLCRHAVYVRLSVHLSVCLFVTFVDHVKTNKHTFNFFSPSGRPIILVFSNQTGRQ